MDSPFGAADYLAYLKATFGTDYLKIVMDRGIFQTNPWLRRGAVDETIIFRTKLPTSLVNEDDEVVPVVAVSEWVAISRVNGDDDVPRPDNHTPRFEVLDRAGRVIFQSWDKQ